MERTLQTPIERKFRHGLIIGKFFPPHQGHLFLIRSAAQFCEHVTVAIFGRDQESFSVELRAQILEKETSIFPNVQVVFAMDNVPVDYNSAEIWDQHTLIFQKTVADLNKPPVDALFSSEKYGDELARRLNCAHVSIDSTRSWISMSASKIRANPVQHWDFLLKSSKEFLCKRFVIVGAESTGKSTMARVLAKHFHAPVVPEFGREYTIAKLAVAQGQAKFNNEVVPGMDAIAWTEEDFLQISVAQQQMENDAAKSGSALIICDTDVFATAIWHERYMNYWLEKLNRFVEEMPTRALYLLLDERGVAFVPDDIRDGETIRTWMSQRFEDELTKRNLPFVKISGTRKQRRERTIAAVENELRWKWNRVE